jgi:hypothetical protein
MNGDERGDFDPNSESQSALGETISVVGSPDLSDRYGSLIYAEPILEQVLGSQSGADLCSAFTLVHEFGHQFGLDDDTGGVMGPGGCLASPHYFTAAHLGLIRTKGMSR